jgi:hypothetical protein
MLVKCSVITTMKFVLLIIQQYLSGQVLRTTSCASVKYVVPRNRPVYAGIPCRNFFLFLNFIMTLINIYYMYYIHLSFTIFCRYIVVPLLRSIPVIINFHFREYVCGKIRIEIFIFREGYITHFVIMYIIKETFITFSS